MELLKLFIFTVNLRLIVIINFVTSLLTSIYSNSIYNNNGPVVETPAPLVDFNVWQMTEISATFKKHQNK